MRCEANKKKRKEKDGSGKSTHAEQLRKWGGFPEKPGTICTGHAQIDSWASP